MENGENIVPTMQCERGRGRNLIAIPHIFLEIKKEFWFNKEWTLGQGFGFTHTAATG